jgi:small-conductance mechanosensitive channel
MKEKTTKVQESRKLKLQAAKNPAGSSRAWLVLVTFFVIAAVAWDAPPNATPTSSPSQIIQFLGQAVDWYRLTEQEQHLATEPGDLPFFVDDRRLADQALGLAFDYARQEEQRIAKQSKDSGKTAGSGPSDHENLARAVAASDDLVRQTQGEVDSLKAQLEKASAGKRRQISSQLAETESELALYQARQQVLHSMLDFANGTSTGMGSVGLRAQIEELARSVPAAASNSGQPENNKSQTSTAKSRATSSAPTTESMWSLTGDLFRLSSKRHALENEIRATDDLNQVAKQLRSPLVSQLRQLMQTGDQLAKQADTSDPAALAQEKQQLDSLTSEFKDVSSALVPLGKQAIVLDSYKRSLSSWQSEVASEFKDKLKGLLARLLVLAIVLGGVLLIGEIWRRAIFRYVHDLRRRYQFLLMRKIVLWILAAIVIIFTFITEVGAVATFAGLITAGVAVALQGVIVSIVGYFFLIGKFGIRVGDRVQAGSVTGEVVDIGLVRFHLMELSSSGADAEPTGRVVAFSNSVVFQPAAALFKQIPGTDFLWHEISLKFAPESDYRVVRARVEQATNTALADYRDPLERQRSQMEMSLSSISAAELKPRVRVRFTTSALEVVIRFPAVLEKSAEIDERVISELFAAVDREPRLKLMNSAITTGKAEAQ